MQGRMDVFDLAEKIEAHRKEIKRWLLPTQVLSAGARVLRIIVIILGICVGGEIAASRCCKHETPAEIVERERRQITAAMIAQARAKNAAKKDEIPLPPTQQQKAENEQIMKTYF